jgi:hypothetical protein
MELAIKIALATIFCLAALLKFSGKTKGTLPKSGYGSRFMYFIGVAELLFAIGLFSPYALVATIGLLVIIIGAIVTLIKQHVAPARYLMAVGSFCVNGLSKGRACW